MRGEPGKSPGRRSPPGRRDWDSAGGRHAACVPAAEPRAWGGVTLGIPRRGLRGGTWRAKGNPPYSPAFKITGSEHFQFKPVSAQLRPICGAVLAAARQLRAPESVAPLSSPALEERPALLWTLSSPGGASHSGALCVCLSRVPERCPVSPSCSAVGCAVCLCVPSLGSPTS